MKNVLVFPCGSEIGIEINHSLKGSTHFKLFGASSVDDHGRFLYENYTTGLPFVDSPRFIDEISSLAERLGIDYIFPAHDSVLLKLIENQDRIRAEIVTSCVETCRICRSKAKTYQVLAGLIPTPAVYGREDLDKVPIFLKPDVGQGSKGTHKANSRKEAEFYLDMDSSLLALEYLPGKEYTVDCFTNAAGELLFSEGRERRRIINGISANSKPIRDERISKIAKIINGTLSFRGVWFFQLKERANGELVLMEIAPRIAGTMALFRTAGVNFAQLSLFDRMGKSVSVIRNGFGIEIDRALFARYDLDIDYDCVYIDFDDVILRSDVVNTTVMKYLYQLRNFRKKVVLLTRHEGSLREALEANAIHRSLFDEIIQIDRSRLKSDYINQKNAIFIDDSYSERKDVLEKAGIPVFGLDAVEGLLYWKE